MKISKERLEQSKKADEKKPKLLAPVVNTREVVVDNTNTEVSRSIDKLIAVIEGKSFNGSEEVSKAMRAIVSDSDSKYIDLVKHVSDKLETAAEALSRKPSSFEFDVQRNHNGFIDKILVKPIRE